MNQLINYLPLEIKHHILTFDRRFVLRNGELIQINLIPKTDERYNILREIPPKEYDDSDGVTFVYLNINDMKDFFITHSPMYNCIQYQTLGYEGNMVYHIDGFMTE